MKKLITTAFILIAAFSSSFAQQDKCATDIIMKQEIAKNPQIAAEIEEFERGFQEWKNHKPIGYREGQKYIIPTVFHVIHEGGSENISKAQIEDQIEILNRDFNHQNADSVNTPGPFRASEQAWFSFTSQFPADYTPYTMSIDTISKVLTSDLSVDGNPVPCGDSAEVYADTVVSLSVSAQIFNLSVSAGGTGYVNGSYSNISVSGGSGTGAYINVTVAGDSISSVAIVYGGNSFADGDLLSVNPADIGGSGSGVVLSVDSVRTNSVTFKFPQQNLSTLENYEPICKTTDVSEIAGTGVDYFYATVNSFIVDSVFADTVSAIGKDYLFPVCYDVITDADTTFTARDSYITVSTPQGVKRSFYFKDGLSNITPSGAPGTLTPVDISYIVCSADSIAKALADAANALTDYYASKATVNGLPTAKVAGEKAGETPDFYSNEIAAITDSTWCQGDILWGRLNVEFRLAQKDPLGNCTEGITRTYSNKTNAASNDNGVKDLIDWNCYSYFNVWVVKSIGIEYQGGTVLGYAQFPASGLCGTDGVVLLHSMTGSIGTAASAEGRTLVHEAGHWLNLIHIWGDADCGSDQVADTPPAFGPNFGICYNQFPYFHADTAEICDNTYPYGEMMVNYMDYSNDECMNMFTVGQCERMEYTLAGPDGNNGIRSYLWSDANLLATGTNDGFTADGCAPIADFIANKTFACTGTSITFTDKSYNGQVTGSGVTREWSFPGGNPSTSSTATQNVSYDTPGVYTVTLTINNPNGSDTETKTSFIHISGTSAEQTADYTYYEDFENVDQFNNNWIVVNPDNTSHKWEIEGGLTIPSGGGSIRVRNLGNTTTEYEEAISPSYNLSNLQSPVVLSYNYSGATTTQLGDHTTPYEFTVKGDVLKVYYSTNCGQSWTQIPQLALTESALINAGLYTDFYVPNANSTWSTKQVTLPAGAANSDNVRFKFSYEVGTGFGNNFYLDGIRIDNVNGVEDLNNMLGIQVFPNPSSGLTTIQLNTPENGKLSLMLMDIAGREVANVYNGSVSAGEQNYNVDVNSFDAGIYFLRINYNDKTSAVKLMVK